MGPAAMWFLLAVGAASAVGVFIWDYRRKASKREAASKARLEKLLKTVVPSAATDVAEQGSAADAPAPKGPAFTSRKRFLDQPQTLSYLLLKTAMPEHLVFANVTLASVLDVPGTGFDREQQLRRLSGCPVDFVVGDRDMRILAVVDVEAPGADDPGGARRYKLDCLQAAGVRRLVLDPRTLPSRETLKRMICGESTPAVQRVQNLPKA